MTNFLKHSWVLCLLPLTTACATRVATPAKQASTDKAVVSESASHANDPAHSGEPSVPYKTKGPDIDQMIAEVNSEVNDFGQEIGNGGDETDEPRVAPKAPTTLSGDQVPLEEQKFPMEINERVRKWINVFSFKDHERFQRFLDRGATYKDGIEKSLDELEVPGEIYYLAMIESGFVEHATSLVGAGGVWQFMPATGRRYGLQVDRFVDERRDTLRATTAAAMYLNDLHNVFNSWYLAIAAYNAGEMRILQGIMKGGSRNFWTLVEKKVLPKETMDYIPKFIAASIIGHNPEHFGFRSPEVPKAPDVTLVAVPSPIHLNDVAKTTGISLEELRRFNYHLTRSLTPANVREYEIWVPSDSVAALKAKNNDLAALAGKHASRTMSVAAASKAKARRVAAKDDDADQEITSHVVRRGDNLYKIAKKYGKSLGYLRRINHLSPSHKLAVGKRLKLVGTVHIALDKSTIRYRVRRGDNLDKIARRFGMSISELKVANDLRRSRLFIGQTLTVRKGDAG